jgi:hypothetical protein
MSASAIMQMSSHDKLSSLANQNFFYFLQMAKDSKQGSFGSFFFFFLAPSALPLFSFTTTTHATRVVQLRRPSLEEQG